MARRAYERETSQISSSPALTEVALNPASWEFGTQADRGSWGQFSASPLSSALKKEKGRGKVPSKLPAFLAAPKRWPHCLLSSPDRIVHQTAQCELPKHRPQSACVKFFGLGEPGTRTARSSPSIQRAYPNRALGDGNEDDNCNGRRSAGRIPASQVSEHCKSD